MKIWALSVSIALHLSLFIGSQQRPSDKKEPKKEAMKEFVDTRKSEPVRIKIQTKPKSKITIPLPQQVKLAEKECQDFYSGIGYTVGGEFLGWCKILGVAPGSPLDMIGAMEGDLLAAVDGTCPGQGPLGSVVEVTLRKNGGGTERHSLTRSKICIR